MVKNNEEVGKINGARKDVAECSGGTEVEDGLIECAGGDVDSMESVKGEKEKASVRGGDDSKCGVSGEMVKEEEEKEKVGMPLSGGDGGANAECGGGVRQMSRETLRDIRRHLSDGRGECYSSVVVFKCC